MIEFFFQSYVKTAEFMIDKNEDKGKQRTNSVTSRPAWIYNVVT